MVTKIITFQKKSNKLFFLFLSHENLKFKNLSSIHVVEISTCCFSLLPSMWFIHSLLQNSSRSFTPSHLDTFIYSVIVNFYIFSFNHPTTDPVDFFTFSHPVLPEENWTILSTFSVKKLEKSWQICPWVDPTVNKLIKL